MPSQRAIVAAARGGRRERARVWAALLLAILLGVLNPLACLIHCLPRDLPSSDLAVQIAHLCHLPPNTEPSAADAPQPSSTAAHTGAVPQAVYAAVLAAALVLLVPTALRRRPHGERIAASRAFVRPLLPPPRAI